MPRKFMSLMIVFCFLLTTLGPMPKAHADNLSLLNLPAPGTMVNLSQAYEPVLIKGLTVHKDNPFLFDFIVDTSHTTLHGDALKKEGDRLVKYFFACLTIPEKDLWVNLSPYEKDKMVPQALGQTALGRDLLAEDYILKQLTASLIYPEKDLGKAFWNRIYAKARQMYGTTRIPVNTFNKVWIVADKATVYEHNQTAFAVDGHLKVMLEEDYLALQKHDRINPVSLRGGDADEAISKRTTNETHSIASQIVRSIILPEIEKEVNTGKNFATLRQIFYSLILANWYKNNLKQALITQVYANKSTVNGIQRVIARSPEGTTKQSQQDLSPEEIYQQYIKAYKKGVFNYIKDESGADGQTIPRKYFSGGFVVKPNFVSDMTDQTPGSQAMVAGELGKIDGAMVLSVKADTNPDAAMEAGQNPDAAMEAGFALNFGHRTYHFSDPDEIRQVISTMEEFKSRLLKIDVKKAKITPGPNQIRMTATVVMDHTRTAVMVAPEYGFTQSISDKSFDFSIQRYKDYNPSDLRKALEIYINATVERINRDIQTIQVKFGISPSATAQDDEILNKPTIGLRFFVRTRKGFDKLGISTVKDITERSEDQFLSVKNFGKTSLNQVKGFLSAHGLRLATSQMAIVNDIRRAARFYEYHDNPNITRRLIYEASKLEQRKNIFQNEGYWDLRDSLGNFKKYVYPYPDSLGSVKDLRPLARGQDQAIEQNPDAAMNSNDPLAIINHMTTTRAFSTTGFHVRKMTPDEYGGFVHRLTGQTVYNQKVLSDRQIRLGNTQLYAGFAPNGGGQGIFSIESASASVDHQIKEAMESIFHGGPRKAISPPHIFFSFIMESSIDHKPWTSFTKADRKSLGLEGFHLVNIQARGPLVIFIIDRQEYEFLQTEGFDNFYGVTADKVGWMILSEEQASHYYEALKDWFEWEPDAAMGVGQNPHALKSQTDIATSDEAMQTYDELAGHLNDKERESLQSYFYQVIQQRLPKFLVNFTLIDGVYKNSLDAAEFEKGLNALIAVGVAVNKHEFREDGGNFLETTDEDEEEALLSVDIINGVIEIEKAISQRKPQSISRLRNIVTAQRLISYLANIVPDAHREALQQIADMIKAKTLTTQKFNSLINRLNRETDAAMEAGHPDRLMAMGVERQNPKARSDIAPGGIDLTTSNGMQWNLRKDGNGVEMNIDRAMIERVRRQGIQWLSPTIYKMTPVASIWPLLGLKTPEKSMQLASI